MSIKLMAQVWAKDIPRPKKYILLALTDHADDNGYSVRPSLGLIAWKTGYSIRQIQRVMKELRNEKVAIVIRPAGQHRPVEYKIDLDPLPDQAPFIPKKYRTRDDIKSPQDQAGQDPRDDNPDPRDDKSAPEMTPESPDSSVKPSLNEPSDSIEKKEYFLRSKIWDDIKEIIGLADYKLDHLTWHRRWLPTRLHLVKPAQNDELETWVILAPTMAEAAWLQDRGAIKASQLLAGTINQPAKVEFISPEYLSSLTARELADIAGMENSND